MKYEVLELQDIELQVDDDNQDAMLSLGSLLCIALWYSTISAGCIVLS